MPLRQKLTRLPWYEFAFLEDTQSELWRLLKKLIEAENIFGLPDRLDRGADLRALLLNSDLLFTQTCGFDIAADDPLDIVFAPSYSAPGCGRGTYSSFITVHEDSHIRSVSQFRSARFVANDSRSWSGYHCMKLHLDRFKDIQFSGSHHASLLALKNRAADVAAVDCIVWELMQRHQPETLEGLCVIGVTNKAPAPPIVTSRLISAHQLSGLRRAFRKMLNNNEARPLLNRLLIDDFVIMTRDDYRHMNS